jgi:ureidoglycolate lyase
MSPTRLTITAEPLTRESFAPYGDVLAPTPGRIDNNTLLDGGHARMSDPVPGERRDDFDVLDYWGDIATISRDTMRLGYLRTKKRALAFSWFERHLKGTQSFMPLGGTDSVICVGRASDPALGALPDLSTVKAFRMDGRAGINLHPGTWHWTPFPVGDAADFIILVREAVVDDDLHFIDLEARMNTRIEIVL